MRWDHATWLPPQTCVLQSCISVNCVSLCEYRAAELSSASLFMLNLREATLLLPKLKHTCHFPHPLSWSFLPQFVVTIHFLTCTEVSFQLLNRRPGNIKYLQNLKIFGPQVTSHKRWMFLLKGFFERKMHEANFILNVKLKQISVLNLIGILSCSEVHSSDSGKSSCLLSLFKLSVLYSFVCLHHHCASTSHGNRNHSVDLWACRPLSGFLYTPYIRSLSSFPKCFEKKKSLQFCTF